MTRGDAVKTALCVTFDTGVSVYIPALLNSFSTPSGGMLLLYPGLIQFLIFRVELLVLVIYGESNKFKFKYRYS